MNGIACTDRHSDTRKPIQPEIERLKKLYEAEEPQEYHKTTLARFYAIQYEEVVRAINFFKVDGMYSTDHGVKGEEYDNVLLVMGRGWNLYKFEDILWKEESQLAGNDLKAKKALQNNALVVEGKGKAVTAFLAKLNDLINMENN